MGGSSRKTTKPFGIKWPSEPIKALWVVYTYDPKLLHEKNFTEKLDSRKKLVNAWSATGLSLYGKVTIIKSLSIPKFIYISSLLPTPKEIIKVLNQLLYKFLWKGVDKVTRLSTINEYEKGSLKMVDLESMIKSLRLAWLKGILGSNNGAWKKIFWSGLEAFSSLTAITMSKTILSLLSFTQSCFNGGRNFERNLLPEMIGAILYGITEIQIKKCLYFTKRSSNPKLFM